MGKGHVTERTFLPLAEAEGIDRVVQQSHTAPVLVFLHDRGCPISRYAWQQMQQLPEAVRCDIWLVDVTRAHAVSRAIEARTGVRHESPQVLLLRDGAPVWDASHFDITADAVAGAVGAQA